MRAYHVHFFVLFSLYIVQNMHPLLINNYQSYNVHWLHKIK